MKTKVFFSQKFNPEQYQGKPLPVNIFNAQGTILAHKGQKVSAGKLNKAFVEIEAAQNSFNLPDQKNLTSAQNENYQEEKPETMEKKLDSLPFKPVEKVKKILNKNIYHIKNIYQKQMIGNVIKVTTKNNQALSNHVAEVYDNMLENNGYAADYFDMINILKNKDNYVTFAHACSTAFYTLAIVKKLQFLKEDFYQKQNLGKWIPVRTEKHPQSSKSVYFSRQMLAYIDRQKELIQVKYTSEIKEQLIERLHDIMHSYNTIDFTKKHPSLMINFDRQSRKHMTIASLNSDIGKLCLPNKILNKPGKLSESEMKLMQKHPILSVKKLQQAKMTVPHILAYILGHHYLNEQKHYPALKIKPHIQSKILAIADIYDAMRSPKHYGQLNRHDQALAHIKELHESGCFDKPLYICARHTFEEFNHGFSSKRKAEINLN